jgi:hypothetical protein
MRTVLAIHFGLVLLTVAPAEAQSRVKFFVDAPIYDPLLAESRAQRNQLVVPGWSKEFPHSVEKGKRFAWAITLGDEFPILKLSNREPNDQLDEGQYAFGLWIPVSFHVIEDFKDTSAPIVDTDYRFGFITKFQYGLRENLRFGIKFVPWAHESTHLGDEYVILAERDASFERINVSHEDWEYGISLEGDQWKVRHHGTRPWGSKGYYSDHLLGEEEAKLTPSRANYEPSFGFEYAFPSLAWNHRQLYVSAEAKYKLIYNYHQTPENPEERQWSINLQVGGVEEANVGGRDRSPLKQVFVQFYRGVNPYGQLRSQKDYWSVGIGWVFGR